MMDLKMLMLLCIAPIALVAGSTDVGCSTVDGGLSAWTDYTPCSTSCGQGVQKRYRFCSSPYPQNGGNPCTGALSQRRSCNLGPCRTCPPTKWGVFACGSCTKRNGGVCSKSCRRKCFRNSRVVSDNLCRGSATAVRQCDRNRCQPDIERACNTCYQKALNHARTLTNEWRTTWPGHACRDSEVEADLAAICRQNKHKQSKNGGLVANNWFWIHCSADGPWCKPCARRNLVFNAKCDACMGSRTQSCSK